MQSSPMCIRLIAVSYTHLTGADVYVGQKITKEAATNLLKNDLKKRYEKHVNDVIKVTITQNMYDALVSRCYNVGNVIVVGKMINAGNIAGAMKCLDNPCTSKGKRLQGLVNRSCLLYTSRCV